MPIYLRRGSDTGVRRPKPDNAFDAADQAKLITGSRVPTTRAIMDHLWLYRRDQQTARQIGLALNCQPETVLSLLLNMKEDGQIICSESGSVINVDSYWSLPS